jgi:tRNA threonylcarbamoyladenosine biosynthesis protein TsaE
VLAVAAAVAAAAADRFEMITVVDGGDLNPVAAAVCAAVNAGDCVYLDGPIGAGKTTLVQACARVLGVVEPVTSPTFALAHLYDGTPPVAHLDLYRLGEVAGRDTADLLAYLTEDAIGFVEWPEYGSGWLPAATCAVRIELADDGTRQFDISLAASRL